MANSGHNFTKSEKERDIRSSNIVAAKAVADTVRTSLGPKGMDKMIQDGKGEVLITNDGATILRKMKVQHPAAKMLVDLSKSQDIEAGDGTTSVVVIAGGLLGAAEQLLSKGIHAQMVTESFLKAAAKAEEILEGMSTKLDLGDRDAMIQSASTSLNSKVVSQYSELLAPMAVDAVMKVAEADKNTVDLNDVRVVTKLGGTVDDSELVEGLVLPQRVARRAGGISRVQNAKVGLIQFCLSPPKTDMENNIVVKDYAQMDRILREERLHIAKMVKAVAATGCNVLLVQKSILRDAVTDLSLDFCAKAKILVVRDIERDDIEYISRMIGCEPAATLESFTADKLGTCSTVFEQSFGEGLGSVVRFTGLSTKAKCVSVLLRASNQLMLDETDRSLHDALCVVRSLVKKRALIAGGGAPEMELSHKLMQWARTLEGVEAHCIIGFAEALEVIPYTLAENAGLAPIPMVTALRACHAAGDHNAGINVRKGQITNILDENVVQPLLVSQSIIKMATETVRMILKIDDLVMTR